MEITMIDFRIETFLSVCNCMNFTKAAEQLHITQPAVSQHIRCLEQLYETKLFSYEGKKLYLTDAGKLLYTTASSVKNDEQFMKERMKLENPSAFPLIFGVTMTIGEYEIASPLASYLRRYPDTNVKIILANTTELLDRIRRGEIHFALVEGYFEKSGFDTLTYKNEPFIPVCAASHIFKKRPSCLEDLLSDRLLVREPGSGTRDILERNLAVRNIRISDFSHTVEVSNMHTIHELLKKDCGISFLYKTAVENELSDGRLQQIHLSDFSMSHDFTFLWSRHSVFADTYRRICTDLSR